MTEDLRTEIDKIIDHLHEDREAWVRRWLMSMGWDGKDIEQAKEIAKDWKIEQQFNGNVVTYRIVKKDEPTN